MNLGQLKTAIIEQVEKVSGPCHADVVRYVNDALLELSSEIQVTTRAMVNMVNGVGELPADCLFPQNVYHDGNRVYKYASDSVVTPDNTGKPFYWLLDGTKIKTIPILASGQLELVYVEKAVDMVEDTDEHNIPFADKFVIAYGVWKSILEQDGPTIEAQYWQAETERERDMWKKIDRKSATRPRIVKPSLWR